MAHEPKSLSTSGICDRFDIISIGILPVLSCFGVFFAAKLSKLTVLFASFCVIENEQCAIDRTVKHILNINAMQR